MAGSRLQRDGVHNVQVTTNAAASSDAINVSLACEELAAVEGWRAANLIASLPDAVRELVRIGLLSEIAKVHQLVEDIRASVTDSNSR